MSAYWAMLGARFRVLLQYRAAALAGISTQVFWGFVRVMIYGAFYASTNIRQPMRYDDVVTYIWLGQAMLRLLPWDVDRDVRDMIRSGTVAYEMLRPVDLYGFWFSRALAQRIAPTLLRAVPMVPVALLFWGMRPPASWASACAFLAAIVGAALLSAAFTVLITTSLLWTISGEGVARILPTAMMLFSGMIVPLPFFPAWAQPILNSLPFRGIVDIPFRLYTGDIPPSEALSVLTHQLVWILAFVAVGRGLLRRGMRRLVVQGG